MTHSRTRFGARVAVAALIASAGTAGPAASRGPSAETGQSADHRSPCPAPVTPGSDAHDADCHPRRDNPAEGWVTWHNARFNFSVCYPAAIFPVRRESPQGHGLVVESSDSAQLIAAAMVYTRATLAEPIRMEKERLTHIAMVSTGRDLTTGGNWFVVSGMRVDQVLYTKAIRTGDRLVAIRLRYPHSLKERYAPIIERIADCLSRSAMPR